MADILIISAHPDDETIGMGGTLLKLREAGSVLHWLIVTKGKEPQWSKEFLEEKEHEIVSVASFFGFAETIWLDFPTVALNTVPGGDVAAAISKVIARIRPSIVYAPPKHDVNADHRAVFEATEVAVRSLPNSPVREFLSYEIPTTTRFGSAEAGTYFLPNYYVDISAQFSRKIDAFKLYRDEIRNFPHPRSLEGLEILAKERGLAIGCEYAEAFQIMKRIA